MLRHRATLRHCDRMIRPTDPASFRYLRNRQAAHVALMRGIVERMFVPANVSPLQPRGVFVVLLRPDERVSVTRLRNLAGGIHGQRHLVRHSGDEHGRTVLPGRTNGHRVRVTGTERLKAVGRYGAEALPVTNHARIGEKRSHRAGRFVDREAVRLQQSRVVAQTLILNHSAVLSLCKSADAASIARFDAERAERAATTVLFFSRSSSAMGAACASTVGPLAPSTDSR